MQRLHRLLFAGSARDLLLIFCFSVLSGLPAVAAEEKLADVQEDPVVRDFLGAGGFGTQHQDAPPETSQFGQLVGIWRAEQEILTRDNGWVEQPGAIWVWKFILGGYATQDLWYQHKDELPPYLGISGRHYLLTGLRVFDPGKGEWVVGWASNAGGQTPGASGGSFSAKMVDGEVVMSGPPFSAGDRTTLQRVVFSDFTPDKFEWRSEFSSDDGQTWTTVMRVHARRVK